MGRPSQKRHRTSAMSQTLPSSPTHSSSSSDFEFTISISPRKSSAALCPADELFYKGQLLPLHLSSRLSMVRTLLLSSASTSSSSDTTTTASRDSTASSSSSSSAADLCDSSRPSSVADDEFKRLTGAAVRKPSKYFSLSKFSAVFRNKETGGGSGGGAAVRRVSTTAKEVIRKYLKKVKPFYERLSQKHPPPPAKASRPPAPPPPPSINSHQKDSSNIPLSFSGNLWYPRRRRSCNSSCPSSMMSSPTRTGYGFGQGQGQGQMGRAGGPNSDSSSMEELQNAIQGAIAHCKNSLLKNKIS
ncbi:probable membrane-associated kinase regulator 1 [Andrographis paniculata]|uniref:probable membrane-associated kinase regulator 1 n=1 Tax=Andrographis paniculata TaxID=175694 RepID=UPI0021E72D9E|nr:probable membrane-associated kinase regulator 1 [Andrographis paniculata]